MLAERKFPRADWWPERLAAALAMLGLVLSILPGFHVRTWQDAGSDFKTLYASGQLFLHGLQAYDFHNIARVFDANGVVQPRSWYAHAPTYPPFTFVLLAPILKIPMVPAVYVWFGLSAGALIACIWSLATFAERWLSLGRPWRLSLIALVATQPVVSFGVEIGNVSVIAAALCIITLLAAKSWSLTWRAAALTISLLLKPHIALWLLVGMLVSRNRDDKFLVLRTAVFTAIALGVFAAGSTLVGNHGMQLHDYTRMVKSEVTQGCLSPRSHDLLPPVAEVTSLESLLGYKLDTPWLQIINGALLLVAGGLLLWTSRVPRNNEVDTRLELFGAWSTFGLLVTYHRTHDAIILFLLFPWVLKRLSCKAYDPVAWGVILLNFAMSLGSYPPDFRWVAKLGLPRLADLLAYRQSALVAVALMLLLLLHLIVQGRSELRKDAKTREPVSVNKRVSVLTTSVLG